MKKLLSLLGGIAIIGGTSATIVACGSKARKTTTQDPIEVARDKLRDLIKKAQELVRTSRKEISVDEALKKAIKDAQKIVDKEIVTKVEITDGIVALQKAIDEFNAARDLHKELQDKIDETKSNKADLESENSQNGWGSPIEKSQKDFALVIKAAEEVVEKNKLTKEEVDDQFKKLDAAIENFKILLPQNIVSQAINLKKESIKNLIYKGWSYNSFFNAEAEKADKNTRLVNLLIKDVRELTEENNYTEVEKAKLDEMIIRHFASKVRLIYLNEQDGQQKIKNIIDQVDGNTGLEQIFLDNVRQEFPDADLKDPNFWEQHPKLSLGVKFGTENLNPGTKEFWTFSLVNDIAKEDEKDVQQLFDEAQARDGGRIIIDIRSGLSKNDGSFTSALGHALHRKVFYGKRFVSNFSATWNEMPNDEQAKDGVIGWKTKNKSPISINIPFTSNTKLFSIKTNITINIKDMEI